MEKVLWGYAVQTARDFEIVIADDGSTEATAGMRSLQSSVFGMAPTTKPGAENER